MVQMYMHNIFNSLKILNLQSTDMHRKMEIQHTQNKDIIHLAKVLAMVLEERMIYVYLKNEPTQFAIILNRKYPN